MAQAGFNNDQSYVPEIKDKAIHVRKVPVPSSADLNQVNDNDATMTPGSNDSSTYAPKSNRTAASYQNGTNMGSK